MYNMDLRAMPSTTTFMTSRVRLGEHPGVRAPAEFFRERVTEHNLGVVPGGRILPGMRFMEGQLPFTAPIVLSGSNNNNVHSGSNNNNMPVDMDIENGGQNGDEVNGNAGHQNLVEPVNLGLPETVQHGQGLGFQGRITRERGESSRQNERQEETSSEGRPVFPQNMGDFNPYYGLDNNDEYSYVNDFDLSIQDLIADRVESNIERARRLDDERGFYQTFSMDVAIPLFYNEPRSPNNVEVEIEGEDMFVDNNGGEPEQERDLERGGEVVMGDDSTHSTEEWPSMGGDSFDSGSPISVMGFINSSEEESPHEEDSGDNNRVTVDVSEHDSMPTEEAPWGLLAASVIGEYQRNNMTVSDSGVVNATFGRADFWRLVVSMPRFKRTGSQKRNFKRKNWEEERVQKTGGGKRKRGVSSDPGMDTYNSDEQDSDGSITSARKRFCREGKDWLARVNAGEGSSRQGGRSMVQFLVEYADDNAYEIEDMVDSRETQYSEDESMTGAGNGNPTDELGQGDFQSNNNHPTNHHTAEDHVGEEGDNLTAANGSGFARVGREQPSRSS